MAVLDGARRDPGETGEPALLLLADVTDTRFTVGSIRLARETIAHNRAVIRAGAIVGLSPIQRKVYDLIVRRNRPGNLRPFDSIRDATVWLSSQAPEA